MDQVVFVGTSQVITVAPPEGSRRTVLEAIQKFIVAKGYPPTIRDIGKEAGIESTSHVSYLLDRLAEDGYIIRDPHISRSIRVLIPISD
jgi:repressor LexA